MNWLKVGAIVVGGIIVFFVLESVVHILLSLLGAIVFVAIVAGGAYVAYKVVGGRRRRQVKNRPAEDEVAEEREPRGTIVPSAQPPAITSQPARYDVDDDLERLKREMGR